MKIAHIVITAEGARVIGSDGRRLRRLSAADFEDREAYLAALREMARELLGIEEVTLIAEEPADEARIQAAHAALEAREAVVVNAEAELGERQRNIAATMEAVKKREAQAKAATEDAQIAVRVLERRATRLKHALQELRERIEAVFDGEEKPDGQ